MYLCISYVYSISMYNKKRLFALDTWTLINCRAALMNVSRFVGRYQYKHTAFTHFT